MSQKDQKWNQDRVEVEPNAKKMQKMNEPAHKGGAKVDRTASSLFQRPLSNSDTPSAQRWRDLQSAMGV